MCMTVLASYYEGLKYLTHATILLNGLMSGHSSNCSEEGNMMMITLFYLLNIHLKSE